MEIKNIKKIVVIMLGGIGNVIMIIPMLRSLRKHYPDAEITMLAGEPCAAKIIEGEDLIDDVVVYEQKPQKRLSKTVALIRQLRKKHIDLAIVASGTNALKGSLLSFLIGARYRIGEDIKGRGFFYTTKVAYAANTHECDGAENILKAIGVSLHDPLPQLCVSKEEDAHAKAFLLTHGVIEDTVLIGIHAGSGEKQKSFKRWPHERFAALANMISKRYNAKIVLTGGNDEVELVNNIKTLMNTEAIDAAAQLSLRHTAALIKQCTIFIGNDSGILHIAAAVKTPSVVICGPTNYAVTGQRGENVVMVRKDLKCSPCYAHGEVNCDRLECLTAISLEDVFSAVQTLFVKRGLKGEDRE
jgi:heptosyltransferase-2